MHLQFSKYQGTGNDFILLDNRNGAYDNLDQNTVARLCDRRFGIGGDGLMLVQQHAEFDFEMVYYNADGRVGSMCGNGGRCIVAFAKKLGMITKETNFLAVDGPHYATISADGQFVTLKMIDLDKFSKDGEAYVMNTGSPHYILEVAALDQLDVFSAGGAIRNNNTYKKEGININFVEPKGEVLHVRTFERGVEDETYACGTGVTAVAIAEAIKTNKSGHISQPIRVLGGDLEVSFERSGDTFSNIFLSGPAMFVFEGTIDL